MKRLTRGMASLWYPVLKCIWPQHVCAYGKSTSTPRRSRISTVARPVSGKSVSLKQVMKSATRTATFPSPNARDEPQALSAARDLLRDHELEYVSLQDHQDGHHDGQPDRPLQNQTQEISFLALQARCARAYGEVLRADHLPQDATRGVGADGQVGAQPDLLCRDFLQVGEQGVRRSVRSRERHPEPPDDGREEREQEARGGSRQAEGKGHAGVIEQEPEPQDGDYCEDSPLELVEGLAVDSQRPSWAYPEDGEGDDVPDQDDRPRRGEPVGREHSVVGRRLRHYRCRLLDVSVKTWPGHNRQPRRGADLRTGKVYLGLRGAHGVFDRAYLHDQEQRDYDDEWRPSIECASERGRLEVLPVVRRRLVLEVPLVRGTPERHERHNCHDRDQGRKEVGELGAEEVRDQKLGRGEGDPADSDNRQYLHHPPEAGHHRDEHARDDQSQKRRLAPNHLREFHRVEARDGPGRQDRDAEPSEGYRGSVRQQRERRGIDGLEAEPRHQGARNGDRRAEAGRRFEKRAENEGDEDHLYPAVVAHAGERVPYGVEVSGIHDDVVDKDGVDHNPDDGEKSERCTEERRI